MIEIALYYLAFAGVFLLFNIFIRGFLDLRVDIWTYLESVLWFQTIIYMLGQFTSVTVDKIARRFF